MNLSDKLGNIGLVPVVVFDKVVLDSGHLNKPAVPRVIDERSVAAPAVGVAVLKGRSGEKQPRF